MYRLVDRTLPVAGVLLGFLAAFWPLGTWYTRRLADGGDEPLGLIVLAVLGIIIFTSKDKLNYPPNKAHLYISGIFFALYLVSCFWLPPILRCIPAIFCIVFYFGWEKYPGKLALMILSLPIITSLQFYLGYPLRLISAETTKWLVWPFVNEITREGTMLIAFNKVVGVDPPCSGIQILWTGLVFTNIIVAFVRMKWLQAIQFNLIAVTLLLLTNSIRAALLFAPESGTIEISPLLHNGIGTVCYSVSIVILVRIATVNTSHSQTRTAS